MVVLLNTLAMLCYTWHYPLNDTFYDLGNLVKGPPPTVVELQKTAKNVMLDNINNFFTLLFNVELLIKILAWGFKQYLADNWNKIDAFVVFVSDGVYFVEEFFTDDCKQESILSLSLFPFNLVVSTGWLSLRINLL